MPSISSLRPPRRRHRSRPAAPSPARESVVDCAVYVDGVRRPGSHTPTSALDDVRTLDEGFVWIELLSPDEDRMNSIAEKYGLHELMVEDAVQAHQRPKLEQYDDVYFLVLRTVHYVEHASVTTASEIVGTGEIMVFLGRDFVITVRHGDHTDLGKVRAQLEADPGRLELGPAAVLHAVADHVVDNYLDVVEKVEDDVDVMEEEVFSPEPYVPIQQIYLFKREVVEMKRAVGPLSSPLQQLVAEADPRIPKSIRDYLRDVADHHAVVAERVAEYDEVLSNLVDAALARVGMQQNVDMRKISAWVAIGAIPTMFAGIYGMNFEHMPELQWEYGYPVVAAVVAVICVWLFVLFRRNEWL
ncbi:MAG: magnesium and cobalt transport protein CorA [Rhodococcus sp. (in: high G+C Gram-positive bacteria)]